jgi:hypothetical protein
LADHWNGRKREPCRLRRRGGDPILPFGAGEEVRLQSFERAVPVAFALALLAVPSASSAQAQTVTLVPHRAVYDLTLAQTRGKATVQAVRGRILYELSGSACEGYTLHFRQVSELDTGEGRSVVSDLRSTLWEEGAAKSFRFSSQNFTNDKLGDDVDGRAERQSDGIVVTLTKPDGKKGKLEPEVVFPNEHMRRIIEAGRAGRTVLELPVFDGSESGQKVYHTMAVIGRAIEPEQRKPTDAAADQAALAGLKRWPVTISYFEQKTSATGEQTPIYAIGFEAYENGISRNLTLDYNDFVIRGEMSALEIKDAKPCP